MKPDIKWLDDPRVFRIGKLPAHSDHLIFKSYEEMQQGNSSYCQSLNGSWEFAYSENAMSRPVNFYETDYDTSAFDRITVPGHIEFAGYDTIHYINVMYPWEGKIYRRPAYTIDEKNAREGSFSEALYNPVGSYRKRFDLHSELVGKRVCIRFEGVEEAAYVWLNGEFVGYSEDSFTPAEFDLTPYIRQKDNVLAVEVHKRSTAAYLEDQDFFRFFGIYRNVMLYAKPEIHLEDMWAKPYLHADNRSGHLELFMRLSAVDKEYNAKGKTDTTSSFDGACVRVSLRDGEGKEVVQAKLKAEKELVWKTDTLCAVIPWDHKNAYLYKLFITIENADGEIVEVVPYEIGFRRVEILDKVIYLNGKRLIFNGVNRHEWSSESGRCIGMKEMEWDMECFKRNNINAVRTCHYPDQIDWYYLCDKNGIYMMSETNMETHGSWMMAGMDPCKPVWNVPGSVPQWKEAVLDRAANNFETFKNHTAILMWSLGNESFAGDNIAAMNQYFKDKDDMRLVHYEGVSMNRAYEDVISDVESRMYAKPREIEDYLNHNPKKPFILCEYMHDMGNSIGGMGSYIALLDKYEMYQGGFIWDYMDQAVAVTDEVTGKKVLRYGGDFDDRPSDYEFSGNGIVFADRTEKPAMQEVKYYYGLHD